MLQTINLTKIYKPKKGVPVTALNGVSLKFPERGMVFLLGKSGSGKSTLLNLLGGLDSYDSGEIIIKGVSSRDFTQTRFDSYRNTYVGFIFQEYNVLEEFTVGANIALALELQGKKATDEEINRILHEVDLDGYGNRKPNELSGGQLQRVAIARALVKNPEIIMADEPTGALDSNTGKQVFDTLKRLSADKLVIIVSHDREYAEYYADRIIELADGAVIGDVEYVHEEEETAAIEYDGNVVTIPEGYHLTEEDRIAINAHIDRIKSGVELHFSGLRKKFRNTDESNIKESDPSLFSLIRSKLPIKSAFRIGGSGLKYKKFRLVVTIFLSVIAFTLFALVDTFGAYNHIKTCTNSISDSNVPYLSLVKSKAHGEGADLYWRDWGYKLTDEEIEEIIDETGIPVHGVFIPDGGNLQFDAHFDSNGELFTQSNYMVHTFVIRGFAEVTEELLDDMGYELMAGEFPDGDKDEIAITDYVLETFKIGGYHDGETVGVSEYEKIKDADDMIGKTIILAGVRYTVTGVVDTHFDLQRYIGLTESVEGNTTADDLVDYFLYNELSYAERYSLASVALMGEGGVERMLENEPKTVRLNHSYCYFYSQGTTNYISIDPYRMGNIDNIDPDTVTWLDGKPRTELKENEIIVSTDCTYSDYVSDDGGDITDVYGDHSYLFEEVFSGHTSYTDNWSEHSDIVVVGYIDWEAYPETSPATVYVWDELYDVMVADSFGTYDFAVGTMPTEKDAIEDVVRYCYREDTSVRYAMKNSVTYELDTVNETLGMLASVFIWIGFGFAVFASIMLANFIGTSIAYKKQEIGILRAIGSRSNDVFRIFFSESFIIAMINFVISFVATGVVTTVINMIVREDLGLLITVLSFGVRQFMLLLVISVGIAFVSSYLPVKKIASKRPIDAIRGR